MRRFYLLDFDNTIIGTERGNITVFHDMMHEMCGHGLKQEDFDHFNGHSWNDIFGYVAGKYGNNTTGCGLRREFISRKIEYFSKHRAKKADGLDALLNLPVKRAIVTGSCRAEIEIFSDLIDFSAFDVIITDDDIKNGKPSPEPYLKALSLLNAEASDALAVEDSRMGITSARAAGIFTVFSRQFADEDHSSIADLTVNSLKELID